MKANRLICFMRLCFIFIYGLSNKLRASVAQKGSGDGQHVPHDDPEHPHPPLSAAAAKLELTFLKLNESAVSGKWISNICLKNILQKNEKKKSEEKRERWRQN